MSIINKILSNYKIINNRILFIKIFIDFKKNLLKIQIFLKSI